MYNLEEHMSQLFCRSRFFIEQLVYGMRFCVARDKKCDSACQHAIKINWL